MLDPLSRSTLAGSNQKGGPACNSGGGQRPSSLSINARNSRFGLRRQSVCCSLPTKRPRSSPSGLSAHLPSDGRWCVRQPCHACCSHRGGHRCTSPLVHAWCCGVDSGKRRCSWGLSAPPVWTGACSTLRWPTWVTSGFFLLLSTANIASVKHTEISRVHSVGMLVQRG